VRYHYTNPANRVCLDSTKQTSSSSDRNVTCSRDDIADKLFAKQQSLTLVLVVVFQECFPWPYLDSVFHKLLLNVIFLEEKQQLSI
jgi:hypothetical protein